MVSSFGNSISDQMSKGLIIGKNFNCKNSLYLFQNAKFYCKCRKVHWAKLS